jgi:site-specific recombinase XerD
MFHGATSRNAAHSAHEHRTKKGEGMKTDKQLSPQHYAKQRLTDTEEGIKSSPSTVLTAASNDVQILETFLSRFTKNGKPSATRMQYEKELRRFAMWAFQVQELRWADFKDRDCLNYLSFCRSLTRTSHPEWIGPPLPYRLRDGSLNSNWRPFQAALSDKAIGYTSLCISSFFSFMADAGYIAGNPWRILSTDQKSPSPALSRTELPIITQGRSIDSEMRGLLHDHVEGLASGNRIEQKHHLRCKLILRLLFNTGMRREEACNARMADIFQPKTGQWAVRVLGKGRKLRTIPLSLDLALLIRDYRTSIGLPPYPSPDETEIPLIPRVSDPYRGIGPSALYKIIKQIFSSAIARNVGLDPATRAKLEQASTHWLRHTFATEIAPTTALPVLSNLLGHEDINTTRRYVTTDLDAMRAALPKTLL